jgi:hypothetical protein
MYEELGEEGAERGDLPIHKSSGQWRTLLLIPENSSDHIKSRFAVIELFLHKLKLVHLTKTVFIIILKHSYNSFHNIY